MRQADPRGCLDDQLTLVIRTSMRYETAHLRQQLGAERTAVSCYTAHNCRFAASGRDAPATAAFRAVPPPAGSPPRRSAGKQLRCPAPNAPLWKDRRSSERRRVVGLIVHAPPATRRGGHRRKTTRCIYREFDVVTRAFHYGSVATRLVRSCRCNRHSIVMSSAALRGRPRVSNAHGLHIVNAKRDFPSRCGRCARRPSQCR